MRVLGAILAGGRSSRFGADKAAALLGGRTLLDRATDALRPQVDALVVCGRPGTAALPGVPDLPAPGLGPLSGLCGALHHAARHGYDQLLAVPCDVPDLPPTLRGTLAAAGACAFVAGLPVIGWWPAALAEPLADWLAAGRPRAVRHWAVEAGAVPVALPRPLANINRPDDLLALDAAAFP